MAHWIMDPNEATLVTATADPVQARSTQNASVSLSLIRGVNIKNLFGAMDWTFASVFANHYLKDHCEKEKVSLPEQCLDW